MAASNTTKQTPAGRTNTTNQPCMSRSASATVHPHTAQRHRASREFSFMRKSDRIARPQSVWMRVALTVRRRSRAVPSRTHSMMSRERRAFVAPITAL
eukprot:1202139-Prymnesium_polylepis.1